MFSATSSSGVAMKKTAKAKQSAAKTASVKKAAKKATTKKTAAKKTAKKGPPVKAATKKASKATAKKAATKKASKAATKKAATKQAATKKASKATASKAATKKASKTTAKQAAAKKASKATAKQAAASKAATKKAAAKKTTAKKAAGKGAKKAAAEQAGLPSAAFLAGMAEIAADHWKVIDAWFDSNNPEQDYRPELPATPEDGSAALARWEEEYGEAFEASLHVHFARGFAHPRRSFMEYSLLTLALAYDRWQGLNELVDEGVFADSEPRALDEDDDRVRFVWWSRGFIPLAEDGGGNLICADMDPGPGGTVGQIVKWEKTEGPLGPLSENLGMYLAVYRHDLERGAIVFDESGYLERRKVREKGTSAEEELFAAVEAGDGATVSRLLAADKKLLDVRNQYDEPLIIPAMQKKHTEVVRAYLDAGVDANTRGPGGRILGYAMSAAAAESVALLLQRGAIPQIEKHDVPESIMAYALYGANFSDHAPEADYLSIVDSLLAAGADPNVPFAGQTPLMKAAAFGSMALVKRLIAAGARVDAVDEAGKNAAAYARSKRRKEVAEYLAGLAGR
uniref:Knr4/Smi1-like domain-containing protein n=1 Tax=Nannocystis pusilla TaxID=889268 RepID=X2KWL9_9BACT|nr:hypothetical protein [Nannocystis pusilla]